MKVGILGAGAMGSLFGGLLAAASHDVWFVDIWREHVEELDDNGLLMTFRSEERRVRGHGVTDPVQVGPVELLMVWVKSFSTEEAIRGAAPMIGPETIVCTLQNGLGNVEAIESSVLPDRIVWGVTGIGAKTERPGHIELTEGAWRGTGVTWIGSRAATGRPAVDRFADLLRDAGIQVEVRDDIEAVVWNKLAMASTMAAVCAVTRLDISRVLDTPETDSLLREMTEEIVAVANAKGIPLDVAEALERSFATYNKSRGHYPSMLQDVLGTRRTEIDALCGAVVREGEAVGVATPVNRTIWLLVRSVEQNYDGQLLGKPAHASA